MIGVLVILQHHCGGAPPAPLSPGAGSFLIAMTRTMTSFWISFADECRSLTAVYWYARVRTFRHTTLQQRCDCRIFIITSLKQSLSPFLFALRVRAKYKKYKYKYRKINIFARTYDFPDSNIELQIFMDRSRRLKLCQSCEDENI